MVTSAHFMFWMVSTHVEEEVLDAGAEAGVVVGGRVVVVVGAAVDGGRVVVAGA